MFWFGRRWFGGVAALGAALSFSAGGCRQLLFEGATALEDEVNDPKPDSGIDADEQDTSFADVASPPDDTAPLEEDTSSPIDADASDGRGDSAKDGARDTRRETPSTCANSRKDGTETDVDCGGPDTCARCQNGAECVKDTDCVSNHCNAGECGAVACTKGAPCTLDGSDCVISITTCTIDGPVCKAFMAADLGTPCSTGFCDAVGLCKPCTTGAPCIPGNACHLGVQRCEGGVSECINSGFSLSDGSYCGIDKICASTACSAAEGVVTRGESGRATTGGGLYTFSNGGASAAPETSASVPFAVEPVGRMGQGLRVTGEMPPVDAANGLYPVAGLGIRFTPMGFSYDASKYAGIEFWAKSTETITLDVHLGDELTDSEYGYCSFSEAASVVDRCYNYAMTTCKITTAWTVCRLPFSKFERPDWGNQGAGLGPRTPKLTLLQFTPPMNTNQSTAYKFDFIVDDVRFVPRF